MTNMLLPEPYSFDPPNVWLTSCWHFNPDSWGLLGFTQKADRCNFLRNSYPGCLIVWYVIKKSRHAVNLRGRIVGFYQVTHEKGDASEFMSEDAYATKPRGKWNYGVRAIRAWRVASNAPPLVDDIAPKTYGSAHPLRIGGLGVRFDKSEALKLLDIEVSEVQVFRGPSTYQLNTKALREFL